MLLSHLLGLGYQIMVKLSFVNLHFGGSTLKDKGRGCQNGEMVFEP